MSKKSRARAVSLSTGLVRSCRGCGQLVALGWEHPRGRTLRTWSVPEPDGPMFLTTDESVILEPHVCQP
ncbi:hypothetical protein PBI_JEANIE_23 [Gordonia phage Jeanie]|uniref:Uncharacterized protein n=2 Tax=root TaxID=1 RepID=A0A160DHR1_9CAUD|nr:hypothetical protein [Gordonia neofelifaecis]YP_009274035.1 hypothetical protein BH764_gp23 [Gordonia phage McGonagall]ANA87601.1 hypothetical protein MCGONAGALL_23 [Gordonia phage McGonagall]ANA87628.1 hypothetical protein PBI_JEANIE_23 [Gordonia phage Jeanie]EGD53227.1 hypothetical protein SCNU_20107 [Gordonia neofelifaecis NRRL B-59395]